MAGTGFSPTPRPAWVQAANRGENPLIAEVARLPLESRGLLAEARVRRGVTAAVPDRIDEELGHSEFPAEPFLANLDRLTRALEDEARLTLLGRWLTRRFLLRLIEVRLQLMALLRADPGLREERIEAPLILAGAPRTGTTILFELLARDPRLRAPRGFELLRPVGPPATGSGDAATDAARIELCERELAAPQTVVSGLRSIHRYGALQPKECLSAMSFALQSEEFTARYAVPSYAAWFEASDLRPGYAMHELVLQVLQRGRPGTRWLLKSPVHLHALDVVRERYPDARIVLTHRDPAAVLDSLASLLAHLRWTYSDAVDTAEIRSGLEARYQRSFDRLVDQAAPGAEGAGAFSHLPFPRLRENPEAALDALYEALDLEVPADLRAAWRDGAAAAEPAGRHAYPRTSPAVGGFARYLEAFGIAPEP